MSMQCKYTQENDKLFYYGHVIVKTDQSSTRLAQGKRVSNPLKSATASQQFTATQPLITEEF